MSITTIEAVRASVTVNVPRDRAFDLFVNHIADWWPLETHSQTAMRGIGRADTVVLEGRIGGEIYEQSGDERHHWGTISAWDPPRRFVIDWQVNPSWPAPTEVEITFSAEGEATRVDLEHRGWERLQDTAGTSRDSYNDGWPRVLARYEQAAGG
jgi:uncharacterized protein YndB with AHSA1/START domain